MAAVDRRVEQLVDVSDVSLLNASINLASSCGEGLTPAGTGLGTLSTSMGLSRRVTSSSRRSCRCDLMAGFPPNQKR